MSKYYYDLHIHSCLSPCGSDDMTPATICGMCALNGINLAALTDHNTAKNCPAFFKAAKFYGIVPIAGMELTTAEDIHVVCLFPELENAMEFDKAVESHRMKIPNRPDIFGNQLIMNEEDEVTGRDEFLLITATDIPIDSAAAFVREYGGICYPAHIDREANGVISALGTFPKDCGFNVYELNDCNNAPSYEKTYELQGLKSVVSSDAHYLDKLKEKNEYFEVNDEVYSSSLVRSLVLKQLG